MKCFKMLVMAHINTIIPETMDPLQFAYHPNRSTNDAISIALYTALSYLDKSNTYVRMLFIDYSSAHLRTLGLNWILDFLTHCPQVVRVGNNTSSTLTLNPGAPQGLHAQSPPVLHVHPRLHGCARLQHHH
jgi:hypothetical protein